MNVLLAVLGGWLGLNVLFVTVMWLKHRNDPERPLTFHEIMDWRNQR